ncbi:hypothetical protein V6N11_058753 [Hibiscus sabdariffa]|uniref:Uncharacterized protein n=1 Tax=Hibiscus sabdariffa TaxID=183260 RepID=A0ABR2U561_9ROSI
MQNAEVGLLIRFKYTELGRLTGLALARLGLTNWVLHTHQPTISTLPYAMGTRVPRTPKAAAMVGHEEDKGGGRVQVRWRWLTKSPTRWYTHGGSTPKSTPQRHRY